MPGQDESAAAKELTETRHRLSREADALGRTAHTLRAEAEKLRVVKPPSDTTS
jgi:hypothetical protein